MATKLIHEAKLAEVKQLDSFSTEFVIKPLYYGYGNTMGNSLRRVLLSSIEGAAITAFSIDGTNHEYSAIAGIREDVLDIMLNLKNIRIKSHLDIPVELTLEIKGSDQKKDKNGSPQVTAGDISLPAEVEVANPDQLICHIDDPNFTLRMRLIVEKGRGYLPIDKSSENRTDASMIALDAVFSPVLRVRYKVENTRVGQDTNLQQLSIVVDTDGTITPERAFEEASAILINQYTALAGETRIESAPMPGSETKEDEAGLSVSVEDLGLSARTANALVNNGIKVVRDLVMLSEADLKELKGFGTKAFEEVKEKLTELNI